MLCARYRPNSQLVEMVANTLAYLLVKDKHSGTGSLQVKELWAWYGMHIDGNGQSMQEESRPRPSIPRMSIPAEILQELEEDEQQQKEEAEARRRMEGTLAQQEELKSSGTKSHIMSQVLETRLSHFVLLVCHMM